MRDAEIFSFLTKLRLRASINVIVSSSNGYYKHENTESDIYTTFLPAEIKTVVQCIEETRQN